MSLLKIKKKFIYNITGPFGSGQKEIHILIIDGEKKTTKQMVKI